jgi:hypothetical protein
LRERGKRKREKKKGGMRGERDYMYPNPNSNSNPNPSNKTHQFVAVGSKESNKNPTSKQPRKFSFQQT